MKQKITGFILLASLLMCGQAFAADLPQHIIDVRSMEEFNSGHIEGALHMPHTQIAELIGSHVKDKDAKIVLYCRSGNRAGKAQRVLQKLGYTAVENGGGLEDVRKRLATAE